MISDVLFDAVEDIQRYLDNGLVEGEIRERIEHVVAEMDAIRTELDTPPALGE